MPKMEDAKIWQELWQAACPASLGKGQIFLPKRTYAFAYESIFNEQDGFWAMALDVPLRGEETLIVYMDEQVPFSGSLLTQVQIHPNTLAIFKKNWLELLVFLKERQLWSKNQWSKNPCKLYGVCKGKEGSVHWQFKEQEIELKTFNPLNKTTFSWKFKRMNDELKFTEQSVTLRHQKNSQTISLHLYPTSCGK